MGISFVGSTPVAKAVYARGAASGKRMQCQGGAKNPVLVMPDADLDSAVRIIADSAFGCAGQRCLAASTAIAVGNVQKPFVEAITEAAQERLVGDGLDPQVEMGPVISQTNRERIEGLIAEGVREGALVAAGGTRTPIRGSDSGSFLRPTVLVDPPVSGVVAKTEIFGPVLGVISVERIDDAIALINGQEYGNMACLFTSSGDSARRFRYAAQAGNIGVNVGVAAPMAFFPFSGWKQSFFGDLHAQGSHAVEFYTQTKVVVERWPKTWSRKF
jgi:malonate-semialdehyde dehydrogenase (acetylating)/methylmalonate-semialdehyde dehydrogenase